MSSHYRAILAGGGTKGKVERGSLTINAEVIALLNVLKPRFLEELGPLRVPQPER
jgi:hypothetical protein